MRVQAVTIPEHDPRTARQASRSSEPDAREGPEICELPLTFLLLRHARSSGSAYFLVNTAQLNNQYRLSWRLGSMYHQL